MAATRETVSALSKLWLVDEAKVVSKQTQTTATLPSWFATTIKARLGIDMPTVAEHEHGAGEPKQSASPAPVNPQDEGADRTSHKKGDPARLKAITADAIKAANNGEPNDDDKVPEGVEKAIEDVKGTRYQYLSQYFSHITNPKK